ncbi:hypothetical protein BCR35DRAFT_356072 [Leucosporidium creatinivorum]|uniref:Uncharacterized protein n=1 Tax=Leucosporidium creatinivorum TaxID=106004 RepID=A0A1Y2CY51_9BASI|nr:hypothetical protein BCR35DRAFT_356072 [Leucosporidium creatinivorum]
MQYDQRRYSTLGPSPIRTPPTSEDGSVVSAVPPYPAPPSAIQHVVADDKKHQQQPPLSPTSPYGSHPSSPTPSIRPPLPSAPSTYRLSPAVEAPSAPSSPHMSDVESMMDTFPPYDVKNHAHHPSPPPSAVDPPPPPQTHFSGSVSASAGGGVPHYQGDENSRFVDLRLMEARKQRAEEGVREERSIEHWREEQERDRARELAQIRTSKPPSIDSGASMSSAGTRRPPSDSSAPRRRPSAQGMTAAESAAQHHFRLAQQHLEAAQRLAADSSLSLQIDRPQATRAASYEDRQASPFDARGGRPFDPFDDGQSTYEYADSVIDPEVEPISPESSFYEDASEFGESRYGSYSSQPRVPPRRSMSLSSVSTSAPSYRSAPPLPPVPSLSSFAGGAYHQNRYDNYRSPASHHRQLPAYPPRQPSNLAPSSSTRPSRSDSLQSTSDASLGSSYTFGGRQPSPSAPIEEGYVEVLQAGGWGEREVTSRAPSPPRRAASIRRSPSIRRGSSPPPPLPTALPHPSTFTQEPVSYPSQVPPPEHQSQYWPPQQPQHRTYSPSELSVSTQLPMYQPPAPSPSAQHRPTPPPQHQAHSYASSPYPQAPPHMYGQPTSYILSPSGHPIPVYAAISAAPPPAPRQALAVHSQPLMYDHRLPYSATPSSAPPSAPPAQPQQLYAAAPTRTGSSPTGILKKSSSNSNLLLSQPNITPPSSASPSQQHPYAHPPPTRPASTWSSSSSEGRGSPSILGGGSNPYPAKLRSRMASLREKLTSSPHVRFQSPVPAVVEAEQAREKEREREMGVQRRDDAVAAMNKSFGMLL